MKRTLAESFRRQSASILRSAETVRREIVALESAAEDKKKQSEAVRTVADFLAELQAPPEHWGNEIQPPSCRYLRFAIGESPRLLPVSGGAVPPEGVLYGTCGTCRRRAVAIARDARWGGTEFDTHYMDVFVLCLSCPAITKPSDGFRCGGMDAEGSHGCHAEKAKKLELRPR